MSDLAQYWQISDIKGHGSGLQPKSLGWDIHIKIIRLWIRLMMSFRLSDRIPLTISWTLKLLAALHANKCAHYPHVHTLGYTFSRLHVPCASKTKQCVQSWGYNLFYTSEPIREQRRKEPTDVMMLFRINKWCINS